MSLDVTSKPRFLFRKPLSQIDWRITILLFLPLILIGVNASWILIWPLKGGLDAWIYTGYFLDLHDHLKLLPSAYFGTRLPWILPGFLAHKLFAPLIANYVLHLAFYYAATFSFYFTLKKSLSKRVAFPLTLLMGTFSYFLFAFGSNYIDGAGITYVLLTLLTLTDVYQSKYSYLRLFLAGVFCSCMCFTQIFLVIYVPFMMLYFLFMNYPYSLRFLKKAFYFLVIGSLSLTLFLCCMNEYFHGKFFFFGPALKTAGRLSMHNDFWVPLSKWWSNASWNFFPLLISVGSLSTLIFYKKVLTFPKAKNILFFQVFFLVSFSLYIFFQFVEKQPVLQLSYYVSYLIPLFFLALGGQMMLIINAMSARSYFLLMILITSLSLIGFSLSSDFFPLLNDFPIYLVFGLLSCLSFLFRHTSWKTLAVIFLVFTFGTFNLQHNLANDNPPDLTTQKSAFLALYQGFERINEIDPERRGTFWFNTQDSNKYLYWALCCNYLCHRRLINESFPKITSENTYISPKEKRKIFVLSTEAHPVEEANKGLIPMGFKGTLDQEVEIHEGPISFKITSLNITLTANNTNN